MKKIILVLTITLISLAGYAQEPSFTIDASQLVSTFKFVDSDNNKQNSDYQSILTGSYGIGYRNIFKNNIIFKARITSYNVCYTKLLRCVVSKHQVFAKGLSS